LANIVASSVLTGVNGGSAVWGDYDNDGDLDILLSGITAGLNRISNVYCNDAGTSNVPPGAPKGLSSSRDGSQVNLSWQAPASLT
jgi:hypothetical protein